MVEGLEFRPSGHQDSVCGVQALRAQSSGFSARSSGIRVHCLDDSEASWTCPDLFVFGSFDVLRALLMSSLRFTRLLPELCYPCCAMLCTFHLSDSVQCLLSL